MDAIFGFLNDAVSAIGNMWWVGLVLLALALFVPPIQKALLSVFGIRLVAEDSLGVVNARFILFRKFKTLPDGKIIALRGEAGYQADTLAPGVHFFLWPWQFEVDMTKFIRIPEGKIGIVEAVDGTAIPAGRVLGKRVECDTFQSARAFLDNGGERGPQLTAMPPGVYRHTARRGRSEDRKILQDRAARWLDDGRLIHPSTRKPPPCTTTSD